jgi:uncharacterized protein involved in oxidation of intracellular sulfur
MNYLFILNDGPYGSEKTYNAVRLAASLQKEANAYVTVHLTGDGVACAVANQLTPQRYQNIELMLEEVLVSGGSVKA